MKVRRKSGDPSPMAQRAAELSAKFAESRWSQSTQNFQPLAFVTHHGTFWVAAGFPPGRGCHSKACETDQEIIDWLNSFAVEPEAEAEPEQDAEPPAEAERTEAPSLPTEQDRAEPLGYPDEPDAMAEELEAARKRIAELEKPIEDETPQPLPPNPTEAKLSDYGEVGEPGVPGDLAQLMMDGEQLSEAVARLTPGIDELLDMASVLSDTSLARAVADFPEDRLEEWTEKLWAEKSILRTKRGTDEENLSRENLISRVAGLFMRVGAKR